MYSQGEIVLIPFPFSDLSNQKVRPAIIISNSIVNKTNDYLFAQITSKIKNDEFSFVLNDNDLTNSLNKPSEVRTQKLFTGNKDLIRQSISTLKFHKQQELSEKIKKLF